MSLINQMLRDLESRRATPAAAGVASLSLAAQRVADAGTPVVLAGSDGQTGGAQRWLIAVIVLLVVLLGLLLWSSQPPWQERMPPVAAATVSPVLSVPVVEMAVEPLVAAAPAEPIVAAPAATEKIVAEAPSRPAPVEAPAPQPPAPSSESSVLSPESLPPVQAPAADTRVNKRIRPLNDEQRAELALRRGVGLLGEGRQAEAERALQEALQFDPGQLRARETLAALYLNNGRHSEAQTLLAEGVRLSPRAVGLVQLYARLLVDQGELEMALTALQRARPSLEENLDYHALLAALYQRAGRHEPAAWTYRQLLAQRGTQAAWWMGLGISLEALGDTTPALEAYLKAHQLGAGLSPQVLAYLGSRIRVLAPRATVARATAAAARKEE